MQGARDEALPLAGLRVLEFGRTVMGRPRASCSPTLGPT